MKKIRLLTVGCFIAAGCSAGVKLEKTSVTIPTYEPGACDKNPVFYTGRVYQGAQGRVYPYPLQDVLHDDRVDKDYVSLELQNEWLKMTLLPEIGGRLFSFTDKQTGFEIFYRQHVIKPALIGMLGAWTSGGVEWNFPHHHRASTFLPVDYKLVKNSDGSKTAWIGETELRHRMKWSIGLSMAPDRAVLQAEAKFMNRQPYIESMLYWANVSVHCNTNYQVIFPPSCRIGMDHHKNYFTPFPRGPLSVDHQWIPSQRSVSALHTEGLTDLSWWKNFTVESRSIFAMDPENDFLAGYDHGRNLGTAHVANRHIVCGKKFFLWGNFPEAFVWDKVLTDKDGPYLELMVGGYSDNQPDYSWIAPYETRVCKQFWYPLKKLDGVKCANLDGAVNLVRRAKDKVFLGFNTTYAVKRAKVELIGGGKTFSEIIDIDPNTPWTKEIEVDPTVADQAITGRLVAPDGRELVRYTPVPDVQPPMPPKVQNPKLPSEYKTVEELYLTGLRLEQFHNGRIDPVPYYEEALRRDPGDLRVNLVMGIRCARNGKYAEAERYLRRSVERTTRNHTRAKDAEPHYYLGVVLREQGKLKEAADEFWKSVWRDGFQRAGYMELARIDCLKGDYNHALEMIGNVIDVAGKSSKAQTLYAYVLRRLGDKKSARTALKKAIACDALDYWSVVEGAFLEGKGDKALERAEKNRGDKLQQMLECAFDYMGIGAYPEADALLAQAEKAGGCYARPQVAYARGYIANQTGHADAAKNFFRTAAAMSTDYCFPFRHEELKILECASEQVPDAANTWYYLGDILYYYEQYDRGISAWEKVLTLNPKHGLALRNLGFAYGRKSGMLGKALAFYGRSLESDPENAAAILEMDKLAEKAERPAMERLSRMEKYRTTVEKSDPAMLRMAYLYNETGRYDSSLAILTTRRFHVWEGGEGLLAPFVDASLLRGLKRLADGKPQEALADFTRATTYPENLQAGRPGDAGQAPKVHYYMAQAYRKSGDTKGVETQLRKALEGWIHPGEMNFYRILVLRELGETKGVPGQLDELKKALAKLEAPLPTVIDASAKFGGENSPMERMSDRHAQALYIKALIAKAEGRDAEAKEIFVKIAKEKPSMLWAVYFSAH